MTSRDKSQERGRRVPPDVDRDDFSDDIHGRNSLQGNDQTDVHNERQAVPEAKRKAEGVLESFKKTEAHEQARRDAATERRQAKNRS